MMKILVSALEPSSNLHLKESLKHIKDVEIKGIFEKSLGEPLLDISEFSVMGFIDILPKIYKAKIAIKEMAKLSKECDIVLLIDAPAFNIPLAKEIKKQNPNIQINYYILPKTWAWKQKRAKVVREYCDNLLSIFPFEDKFYENPIYVGNPLLDMITTYNTSSLKNGNIALLAGSRKSEIKSLMPLFRELKNSLNKNYTIVIPPFFSD
ncbi:MAG: lipid-A-disaccharide synthase, partial [Campylobacterales bacterium]|nr:lipid-A-disaccharide synthase [Campylobacterales bacterium]